MNDIAVQMSYPAKLYLLEYREFLGWIALIYIKIWVDNSKIGGNTHQKWGDDVMILKLICEGVNSYK